ncbi:sialate O-acetylesterase [Aquirufa lenticrescens]|uniref:sialate O-acetylesterase n=1 Tax=Aquirufa lenticrescens TaxID=2696560 RepID=UPI001CAA63FC|nr:sialate O-acetylesterase [Aquirufa lenticrescens]UAJ14143.1 sialate O-acetylesterase [Aquirufa lenticrescens]
MKKIFFLLLSFTAFSAVKLPSLVSNGMVLQRDMPVKIWGWANPGEKVNVTFKGKKIRAISDSKGNWACTLPATPAGGPYEITINEKSVKDVLFGDVWLCAGQSNMVINMERVKEKYPADIASANNSQIRNFFVPTAISKVDVRSDLPTSSWLPVTLENVLQMGAVSYFFAQDLYAQYRVPIGIINSSVGGTPIESWISEAGLKEFPAYVKDTTRTSAVPPAPRKSIDRGLSEKWESPSYSPKGWKRFSIPGFWEDQGLRDLNGVVWFRREIDIPEALEGQPAKLFMGRIVDADQVFVNGEQVGNITYQYPPRRYNVKNGLLKAGKNLIVIRVTNTAGKGGFVPDKQYELIVGDKTVDLQGDWNYKVGEVFPPVVEKPAPSNFTPTALYNAMIAPFTSYALKGFVWYQGETNVWKPEVYQQLLPALAKDWRTQFQQPDLPFLYVQLPGFQDRTMLPAESNMAVLRDGQLKSLSIPRSGMAVTLDLGEWNDIHPLTKKPIGERLALAARKLAYGENIVSSGPIYESNQIEGNRIRIRFRETGSRLSINKKDEDELTYFAIAGKDKKFVWAKAIIERNTVVVWSDEVPEPVYVRYGWADNPEGANLINAEGLPASPFRTDN